MLSRCASRRLIVRWHQNAALRPKRRWKHEAVLLPSLVKPNEEESLSMSLLPQVQKGTLLLKNAGIPLISQANVAKTGPRSSRKPFPTIPLGQWYKRNHPNNTILPSAFEASMVEKAIPGTEITKKWHTVTFTCPVTGHVMDAGTIRRVDTTTGMGNITVIDGKIYYERKSWARRAACYRMMDSIRFAKTQQTEPRDCEEDPIVLPNELFQRRPKNKPGARPKNLLNNVYQKLGIQGVSKKGIAVTESDKGWTANFTCPISGYTVEAGVLRGSNDFHAIDEGAAYYKEEVDAQHAAAARFLDNLRYTQTGEIEPRWCDEVPSLIQKKGTKKVLSNLPVENKDQEKVLKLEMLLEEQQSATHLTMMRAVYCDTKMQSHDVPSRLWMSSRTPKALLNVLYLNSGIAGVNKKGIAVTETDKGWTANFTCPITGYTVEAGVLRGSKDFHVIDEGAAYYKEKVDAQHAAAARFLDNLRYTETREIEPRWCEEVPSLMQEKGTEKLLPNLLVENNDQRNVLKPEMLLGGQHNATHLTMMGTVYGETKMRSDDVPFRLWMSSRTPKALLNVLYFNSRVHGVSKKGIAVTETDKGWTANFTCPITGYTVEAGALRGSKDFHVLDEGVVCYKEKVDAQHAVAARFLDDLRYTETGEIEPRWCEEVPSLIQKKDIEQLFSNPKLRKQNGLVLETKVTAEPAAAKDAHGEEVVFSYQPSSALKVEDAEDVDANGDDQVLSYRPSSTLKVEDAEDEDANGDEHVYSYRPSSMLKVEFAEDEDANCDEQVFSYQASSTLNVEDEEESQSRELEYLSPLQSHEGPSLQEPEDEEELMIQNISAFKPAGKSTLERVMEVLGETVSSYNINNVSSRSPMQTTLAQQKEKVIDDTIAWYKRLAQQEKPEEKGYLVFQTTTLPMTARSATAALRVLAKAHWSHPSEDPDTDQRVEYAAKQMIDLTWTAGSPSVDGYNSYLICLARSNAAFESAEAAEHILHAMLDRKELDGRLLPEPNIGTFNAVIQLWAIAGGSTGVSKCEEIFDLIQEGREKGFGLQPNRDTFLSVLSSLARPIDNISSFNRERAQQWIERMRRLGDDNNDDTLAPDTQVFNAPLRWSGGSESTRSRPFTQGLSWDKYPDIFKEGFLPFLEEDPLWIEACRIEEWLLEMETKGPAPDVETFEAAIQAWSRTGMAEGLRRAELVALRALASDKIRPRLQSFHPLFAAQSFSGDEHGPEKIQEWIARLEERSKRCPETKPDTRLESSLFIAKRTQQKRLLARKDDTVDGSADQNVDAIAKATQIAKSCSDDLGLLVGQIRQKRNDLKDAGFLDPAIFSHALCAWGDVAVAKRKDLQSDDETLDGMDAETQAMLGIVKQFDETIQHLRSKQAAQHESSNDHPHFNVQLEQFLRHSLTFYLNALTYLNELDHQRKNQGPELQPESLAFYQHFFDAELMLRRAEELRMVLHASTQSSSSAAAPEDVTLVYDDMYTYPSDISDAGCGKSYREKQIALYLEIVDGCKRVKETDCFSDSVRLCMLIVDLMDHAPPTAQAADCTDLYLGIISVVEDIPEEHERYEVLSRVFHSVNSSPFTIDKDSIMALIKGELPMTVGKGRKKPGRARRPVKRQRWRSASQS